MDKDIRAKRHLLTPITVGTPVVRQSGASRTTHRACACPEGCQPNLAGKSPILWGAPPWVIADDGGDARRDKAGDPSSVSYASPLHCAGLCNENGHGMIATDSVCRSTNTRGDRDTRKNTARAQPLPRVSLPLAASVPTHAKHPHRQWWYQPMRLRARPRR